MCTKCTYVSPSLGIHFLFSSTFDFSSTTSFNYFFLNMASEEQHKPKKKKKLCVRWWCKHHGRLVLFFVCNHSIPPIFIHLSDSFLYFFFFFFSFSLLFSPISLFHDRSKKPAISYLNFVVLFSW